MIDALFMKHDAVRLYVIHTIFFPFQLFKILKAVNGGYDEVRFCELDDDEMENWEENT